MAKRIVVIQGHPDPAGGHFGHALADAYAEGARQAGHEITTVVVARLEFPMLRTKEDWDHGAAPAAIRSCQETLGWADHVVIVYPLWLGSMPALLKAFLEQLFRPGFAFENAGSGTSWRQLLKGKTAHIVITMGMPAWLYRWFFGAHSLKSLERNILRFVGIKPVRESLIGSVEGKEANRAGWLARMRSLGTEAG
jgi:putative NADPH-quinone reductase